jgi:hypothetical protein
MAALYRQAADMGVSVNNLAIIAIKRGLPIEAQEQLEQRSAA